MSKEYPLFPELPEEAQEQAVALIEKFKVALAKAAEEVISDLYVDVMHHIEGDSWTNFRNCLMDRLRNYGNRKLQADYDFKDIRQAILREYRTEIIADLNQDMVAEIARLKEQVEWLGKHRG